MTYTETQQTINEWQKSTFGKKPRRLTIVSRLHREVSQLMEEALSARRPKGKREAIMFELSDLMIMSYHVASVYNFDLLAAVDAKMALNRQKTWTLLHGEAKQSAVPSVEPTTETP